MAKWAMLFGVLLIAVGAWAFSASEKHSPTALIPAGFGIAIAVCGLIALNPAARMHAMHAAAMLGLLGLIGSAVMLIRKMLAIMHGTPDEHPLATYSQAAMAVLCLVFLYLCIRSFIHARRQRLSAT